MKRREKARECPSMTTLRQLSVEAPPPSSQKLAEINGESGDFAEKQRPALITVERSQ